MIGAIISDLDGLPVDSERYWNEARRAMAAEHGVAWNADDHRACMGVSTRTRANYMIRRLNLELVPEQVEAQIICTMVNLYAHQIPYLPGALEAVDLAARHFPTDLASGSPRVSIDAVTRDAPMHGKPAPDVSLEAACLLGIEPAHCVCLEDSGNGILSGKNAGMKVIAVTDARYAPTAPKILRQANSVLSSPRDFNLDVIRSWEKS